jgi:hypothetical protein
MTRSPAYLSRNKHSYCFRTRIPNDLQRYLGKKELRYSLRTGYLSEAKFKARVLAAGVQLLFRRLRELKTMKLTDKQITEIAIEHLKNMMAFFNAPKAPLDDEVDPFLATFGLKKLLDQLAVDKFEIITDLETGNYKEIVTQLPDILGPYGIDHNDLDQDDPSFVSLC